MNINKLPAKVGFAISGLLGKISISFLIAITVTFILSLITEEYFLLFLGAMIMQLIIRAFEKDVRRDIKNIWIYFNAGNPTLSHWQYSSEKEKTEMEFYNFINPRMDDIQELPPIVSTPEEFAYHAGWIAYFNNNCDNPYGAVTEESLYMSWADGWKSAGIVASSITNV